MSALSFHSTHFEWCHAAFTQATRALLHATLILMAHLLTGADLIVSDGTLVKSWEGSIRRD